MKKFKVITKTINTSISYEEVEAKDAEEAFDIARDLFNEFYQEDLYYRATEVIKVEEIQYDRIR